MGTELIKKTIDAHDYQFEQFGAKEALRVLARLSKLIGRPFVLSVGAFKGEGKPLDTEALGVAASALFDSIDEEKAIDLIEKLSCGPDKVLCDGKRFSFDKHYEGKLDHLFKVLSAALEVQYGNFFVALSEYLGARAPQKDSTLEKSA